MADRNCCGSCSRIAVRSCGIVRIVFFFAIVSFMNAWLIGNFQPTRVFVIAFLVDFTLRIFVNPRLAPSLILGQWIVRKQQPEYVGAPQKRFAWAIGFVLALIMLYLAFRFDIRYAPGAVVALIHDAIFVVGAYAIT